MSSRVFSFKSHTYTVRSLERFPQDPTWFSHEDESTVRERDWNINSGDVVLDIGSAYGSYALTALAAGASFVCCFNPNEEENSILKESLELNGWGDRAKLLSDGLYSQSGYLNDLSQIFTSDPTPGSFKVLALDDIFLHLPRLDWMKMDVEGAELEVLKGAKELIGDFQPNILVENHQFKDASLEHKVCGFLMGLGYEQISCYPYHGVSHALYKFKA